MREYRIYIWILSFLISLVLGFGLTKVFKPQVEILENDVNSTEFPSIPITTQIEDGNNLVNSNVNDPNSLSSSNGDVVASVDTNINLKQDKSENRNENVQEEKSKETNPSVKTSPISQSNNKMTASDFQRLLIDQNDNSLLGGRNPYVAKKVTIIVNSIRDGEKKPQDILDVRDKIANGIWTTTYVQSVGYDAHGKVNSVVITPQYPN
ncbi:MAG: hypothetical protein HUJ68_12240 [Clostridia bacterium]|nr:hypothetical protein [Clostridia bacterium]